MNLNIKKSIKWIPLIILLLILVTPYIFNISLASYILLIVVFSVIAVGYLIYCLKHYKKLWKYLLLIIILAIGSSIFLWNKYMIVQISKLPQQELWTDEYAQQIREKAVQKGIPRILDEQALLELVKHAWQWDKNAMLQYADIVENEKNIKPESKEDSLGYFLVKHSHALIDAQGNVLSDPPILKLPYKELVIKLADNGHPQASAYVAAWMLWSGGQDEEGDLLSLNQSQYQQLVGYIRNSITGGYHKQSYLADTLIFKTSSGYKDKDSEIFRELIDYPTNTTTDELNEAVNLYKVCAQNGSLYCMVRLTEANLHGVGTKKDYVQAYCWAKSAQEAYNKFMILPKKSQIRLEQNNFLNTYSSNLLKEVMKNLSDEDIQKADLSMEKNKLVINWDYDTWRTTRDQISPKP